MPLIPRTIAVGSMENVKPILNRSPWCGIPVFRDDFRYMNGLSSPNGWSPDAATWTTQHCEYEHTDTLAYSFAGDPAWRNYVVKVLVKFIVLYNAGICFRATDRNNTYIFDLNGGTETRLYCISGGSVVWGTFTTSFTHVANRWYELTVEVRDEGTGVRVKCYVDNQLLHDRLEDPRTFDTGMIGLRSYRYGGGAHAVFDRVRVWKI